jgi:DNA replication protein DnaC
MTAEAAAAPCPDCEGRGWVLADDGSAGTARPCACRASKEAGERLERSGIPLRYLRKTLHNFDVHSPRGADQLWSAKRVSQQYVASFLSESGRFRETGLLFIGPPGGGKTHLAVGVLRALIERYAVRGRFIDFTHLVHQIQSSFDPGSDLSKRSILDPIIDAEVLVLDELGAQRPTPFVNDILYLVLNTRYTRCLPTLFTTNHPLGERQAAEGALDRPAGPSVAGDSPLSDRIPARLISRLYEMAQVIELPVEDFRREVMSEHASV